MAKGKPLRFRASTDVVSCTLEDGAALLDLRSNKYFSLNPVASAVWERLGEGASLDELVALISSTFDVDDAACREDLEQLLGDFSANALVVMGADV